jgi:nucleotide-binding universal stress UspA family protein
MSSIFVGLDLSPFSRAALQWAAQHARLTGGRLLAINAVPIPPSLDRAVSSRQLEQPTAGLRD